MNIKKSGCLLWVLSIFILGCGLFFVSIKPIKNWWEQNVCTAPMWIEMNKCPPHRSKDTLINMLIDEKILPNGWFADDPAHLEVSDPPMWGHSRIRNTVSTLFVTSTSLDRSKHPNVISQRVEQFLTYKLAKYNAQSYFQGEMVRPGITEGKWYIPASYESPYRYANESFFSCAEYEFHGHVLECISIAQYEEFVVETHITTSGANTLSFQEIETILQKGDEKIHFYLSNE